MKRDPSERGAALFIVVMVVMMLSAIGTFAIHATSLSQLAAGYSRRAASAFYLGEFAMNLVAANVADDPQSHVAIGTANGSNQSACRETANLAPLLASGAPIFCDVKDSQSVKAMAEAANSSLSADPEGFFGTLMRPDGPTADTVSADFRVEITDHAPAPTPTEGMPMEGTAKTWQDAFTVTARLMPTMAAGGQCQPGATQASENQSFRGYVVYTTPN